jgi:2-amino-4-hydroxy-6-hydroxymethyldihydropteridine diphosphokinase
LLVHVLVVPTMMALPATPVTPRKRRPKPPTDRLVVFGLGSNMGDRQAMLRSALNALTMALGRFVAARSAVYETPPWGKTDQPPFLNGAVAFHSDLSARELIAIAIDVEARLGRAPRTPQTKNGPRTIDIDLLFAGSDVVDDGDIQVPHPRLHERAFVLKPLLDLDPQRVHPVLNASVAALAAQLPTAALRACKLVVTKNRAW